MSKYLFAALIIFLWPCTAHSQFSKPKLQLEAGFSRANMKLTEVTETGSHSRYGSPSYYPTYGGLLDFRLNKNHSVSVGASRYVGGTKFVDRGIFAEYVKLSYIKFPINYKYSIITGKKKANAFITVGPYLSYLVKGESTTKGWPHVTHKGDHRLFNRFDMGIGAGLGYMIPSGVYFKGTVTMGLHDFSNVNDGTLPYKMKYFNRPNAALVVGVQF